MRAEKRVRLGTILLAAAILCLLAAGALLIACQHDGTADSKSAYELAVENGYTGTELEWLASLAGELGADGESAYEIAAQNGYTGTEAEWLDSLIGASGKDGADGKDGVQGPKGEQGIQGEKGDKGDQGEQGIHGEKGDKGDQGEQGIQGEKGDKGDQGEQGIQGEKGDKGDKGDTGAAGKSAYVLAVENGFQGDLAEWLSSLSQSDGVAGKSAYELAVDNGYQGTEVEWLLSLVGEDGEDGKSAYELAVDNGYEGSETLWLSSLVGAAGKSAYELACEDGFVGDLAAWLDSLAGEDGVDGVDGKNGKSAYELAVENGFDGSVTQWLASLVGASGEDGEDGKSAYEIAAENGYRGSQQEWLASLVGASGEDGEDGKSAYEIAVAHGYQLSEEEWLSSLAGKDGLSAYEIAVKNGFEGDEAAWLASLKGETGEQGSQGERGEPGVGIADAYVNDQLHLIIVLTNGKEIDAGYVGVSDDDDEGGETPPTATTYTVTFKDWNGTVLKTETVESGKAATEPADPSRAGYSFIGWDKTFDSITADLTVTAQYQKNGTPTMSVGSATAQAGSTGNALQVEITNNPGILGMNLKLEYNDDVITVTGISLGDAMADLSFTKPATYKNGCNLVFYGTEVAEIIDGEAFTIRYKVASDAPAGTYTVKLSGTDVKDTNKQNITLTYVTGTVTVSAGSNPGGGNEGGNDGGNEGGETPPVPTTYTVTFQDWNGTVLKTEAVDSGKAATAPTDPSRSGYVFIGWDKAFNNITGNLTVTAQYEKNTTPTLTVFSDTVSAGTTKNELPVIISNNPGILGMNLKLEYDDSVITVTRVSVGDAMADLSFTKPAVYKNGCNLVFYGTEVAEIIDGEAFILRFDVADDAPAGTYIIKLSGTDVKNTEKENVVLEFVTGVITVTD